MAFRVEGEAPSEPWRRAAAPMSALPAIEFVCFTPAVGAAIAARGSDGASPSTLGSSERKGTLA